MEKLKVVKVKGVRGYVIASEAGEIVALTYDAGAKGKAWAERLVKAVNAQPK